ncbi:MAG: diacylglycerol kinase family protein [Acutalibacteraceae bacterium]
MENYIKLFKSFGYAFKGIVRTVNTERNLRIHITCLVYMFSILGFTDWFTLNKSEWAILVVTSGTVIAGELFNTAIENAVNLSTTEYNKFAEISKDAASGAVLVSAIFAVIVGLILLFQPEAFKAMYNYFKENLIMLAVLILSIIPATVFIFFGFNFKRKK